MLDSVLAQKLVRRIMKQLGYNVNIMNEKGIIIASGDSNRIGDFLEIAYKIINEKLDIVCVAQDDPYYIGVKPGINMPIYHENKIIGVIGITGEPEKIKEFSYIVRLAVETMVEHELYKQQIQNRYYAKNVLLHSLIYETPIDESKIKRLASDIGYEEKYPRVSILVCMSKTEKVSQVINIIKSSPKHTKQDITLDMGDGRILILKTLPVDSVVSYKAIIRKYVYSFLDSILIPDAGCSIFVGTPEFNYRDYRKGFEHALWLQTQSLYGNEKIHFFIDYATTFLRQKIKKEYLEEVFGVYKDKINDFNKNIFISTIKALAQNGMNINKASKAAAIHRNTMNFRLSKIKNIFNMDPANDVKDLDFLLFLVHYIENNEE